MRNTFVQIVEGSYENATVISSEEFESWEDAWARYIKLIEKHDSTIGQRVRLAHKHDDGWKVIQETRFYVGQK
ncbi:MAG: hypothetical protein HOG95_07390 [Rhodospirillaceae bacterium]|nr:hypothetical protein [Rhodospirillaceae bacterium]